MKPVSTEPVRDESSADASTKGPLACSTISISNAFTEDQKGMDTDPDDEMLPLP